MAKISAEVVINEARDQHQTFDARRHPDPVLLRWLSNFQRRLLWKTTNRNSQHLAQEFSISLPVPDFLAGTTLPDNQFILPSIELIDKKLVGDFRDSRVPVAILAYNMRNDAHPFPAVFIRDGTLFQTARPELWETFLTMIVPFIPKAPQLTALADLLVFDESAQGALASAAARFMASRASDEARLTDPVIQFFLARAADMEDEYLREVGGQRKAQVTTTRDVWP